MDADDFANWVKQTTGESFTIQRPFDYQKLVINLGLVLFALATLKLVYSKFASLLNSSTFWAAIGLIFIIHMTCGYMWNQIRHAPYSGMGGNGKLEIIAGNFQSQYQVETQLISAIYAVCAAAVVFLVQPVPKMENPNMQRSAIYGGLMVFMLAYSILIAIFRCV